MIEQPKVIVKKILFQAYQQNPSDYKVAVNSLSRELQLFRYYFDFNLTKEAMETTVKNFIEQIQKILDIKNGDHTLNNKEHLDLLLNFMLEKLPINQEIIEIKDLSIFKNFFTKHLSSPGKYEFNETLKILPSGKHYFTNFIKYEPWNKKIDSIIQRLEDLDFLCVESKLNIHAILLNLQEKALEFIDNINSNNSSEARNNKIQLIQMLQSLIRISCNIVYDNAERSKYTLPSLNLEQHPEFYDTLSEKAALLELDEWLDTLSAIQMETTTLEKTITEQLYNYAFRIEQPEPNHTLIKTIKLIKNLSQIYVKSLRYLPVEAACDATTTNAPFPSIEVTTLVPENTQYFSINPNLLDKLGLYKKIKEHAWIDHNNFNCIAEEIMEIHPENERSLLLNFFEILANGESKYEVKLSDLMELNKLFKYFALEDPYLQQELFDRYMLAYINCNDLNTICNDLQLNKGDLPTDLTGEYNPYSSLLKFKFTPENRQKLEQQMLIKHCKESLLPMLNKLGNPKNTFPEEVTTYPSLGV